MESVRFRFYLSLNGTWKKLSLQGQICTFERLAGDASRGRSGQDCNERPASRRAERLALPSPQSTQSFRLCPSVTSVSYRPPERWRAQAFPEDQLQKLSVGALVGWHTMYEHDRGPVRADLS